MNKLPLGIAALPRPAKYLLAFSILLNIGFIAKLIWNEYSGFNQYFYDVCLAQGGSSQKCRAIMRLQKGEDDRVAAAAANRTREERERAENFERQSKIEEEQCKKVCPAIELQAKQFSDGVARYEELRRKGFAEEDLKIWLSVNTRRYAAAGFSHQEISEYFFGKPKLDDKNQLNVDQERK